MVNVYINEMTFFLSKKRFSRNRVGTSGCDGLLAVYVWA